MQALEEKRLDEKVEAECGGHKVPLKKEKIVHLPLDEPVYAYLMFLTNSFLAIWLI